MKPDEFSTYSDYFIVDYADEIAANFGHPLEESRTIAAKELADDLPQGVGTPGHHLLCIETSDNGTIGYLWYRLLAEGSSAFILDFYLFDNFRGQGNGRATLAVLEAQLAQQGVEELKLRVAFKNERARYLYEKVGFNITGYNMRKVLQKRES